MNVLTPILTRSCDWFGVSLRFVAAKVTRRIDALFFTQHASGLRAPKVLGQTLVMRWPHCPVFHAGCFGTS
jgi:hypothetical protein